MMAVYGVILLFFLLNVVVGGDINNIMDPGKRCIPTATQIGDCHVCVCKTDGVYYCKDIRCDMYTRNITDPSLPECAANHTYRLDTIFCTCDPTGHWRAEQCKRRLSQVRSRTHSFTLRISTNIECTSQHFYISECNVCDCEKGLINFASCTNRLCPEKSKLDSCNPGDFIRTAVEFCGCSDSNDFKDIPCLKINDDPIQEVSARALDSTIDFRLIWDDLRVRCKPFYTYKIDCSFCYCNEYGQIYECKYVPCEKRFIDKSGLRARKPQGHFQALPELNNLDDVCKPGVKYRYGCNSCYCTIERRPICTSMTCLEKLRFEMFDLRIRQKKRN